MNEYHVEESKVIDAPAERVYEIIADYHAGHPQMLPSRYFRNLTVIDGGKGTGTKMKVEMNIFGTRVLYNMTVTEPQPGRLLVEEDNWAGVVTTFKVDPLRGHQKSEVTISTQAKTSPGLRGKFEKILNPPIIRIIYRQELIQLSKIATTH